MAITTDTRLNQVKAHMLNYISQNNLKRNDQLPSEASISKGFQKTSASVVIHCGKPM